MITEFFMDMIFGALELIVSILPNPTTLPAEVNNAFVTIGSYAWIPYEFFPVDTLYVVLGLVISVEVALLSWGLTNYLYRLARG